MGVNALAAPEMARDGVSGIIVEPYDAEVMAEAFGRLADDGVLRERLGRTALGAVQVHALDPAVDRLERTYTELVAMSPSRTKGYAWQEGTGSRS